MTMEDTTPTTAPPNPTTASSDDPSSSDSKGPINTDQAPTVILSNPPDEEEEEEDTLRYNEAHQQIEFGTLAEQKDETHYDRRFSSKTTRNLNSMKSLDDYNDVDIENDPPEEEEDPDDFQHSYEGRIEFPQDKLYGRENELERLQRFYQGFYFDSSQDTASDDSDNNNKTMSTLGQRRCLFLSGTSGSGKSALMEFMVQQQFQKNHPQPNTPPSSRKNSLTTVDVDWSAAPTPAYLSGKFQQLKAGAPFSAISKAVEQYLQRLLKRAQKARDGRVQLKLLAKRLQQAEIVQGSRAAQSLAASVLPGGPLEELLEVLAKRQERKQNKHNNSKDSKDSKDDKDQDGGNHNNTKHSETTATDDTHHGTASTSSLDLNLIKFSFCRLLGALATDEQPLLLFVDDLQWADMASLELLTAVVQDASLEYVMLVGAYRSNEVTEALQEFETKATQLLNPQQLCQKIELFNLSPDQVGEFIADCISMNVQQVKPITEAVYSKTLGNIFFVKQALEELVRKNAIYYDVITYQWQFSDSGVTTMELTNHLSDDVIQMVQGKLATLDPNLQTALALAACCNHNFDAALLVVLLQSQSITLDLPTLDQLLQVAFDQGLILHDTGVGETTRSSARQISNRRLMTGSRPAHDLDQYKFAHDRIREAATQSIGEQRDEFLLKLSVLLVSKEFHQGHAASDEDWMLFCAARHFNSLPRHMTNDVKLAKLNLQVGKISVAKGSFGDAVDFFRHGVGRLHDACWRDQRYYDLVLELHNYLLETENFLGHVENRDRVIQTVFEKAKTTRDKLRAQYAYVEGKTEGEKQNYSASVDAGLECLRLYGIDIPDEPTDKQVRREHFNLRLALKGRSLLCLVNLPLADPDEEVYGEFRLASVTLRHGGFCKRSNLVFMLGYRMYRMAIQKKKITLDLPSMLMYLGGPLRAQEDYKTATVYANVGKRLLDRFPNEMGTEFIRSKAALSAQLICLWTPFRDVIETYLDLNKVTRSMGIIDISLAMAMVSMYTFLAASFPLGMLFEPKLLLFEEAANEAGKAMFGHTFRMIRQSLYNLQGSKGAAKNPTELQGDVFDEEKVLANCKGPAKMMNGRDTATLRIMLAVIFDDYECMEAMLERLAPLPIYDIPIVRQHIRFSFVALASQILVNKYPEKEEKFGEIREKSFGFIKKLAGFGSPNAEPVFRCLKALRKPSVASFEEALHVLANTGLLHLHAIMNERYGIWLMDIMEAKPSGGLEGGEVPYMDEQPERCDFLLLRRSSAKTMNVNSSPAVSPEEPIKMAMWCFQDWGASAKVLQMRDRYEFLHTAYADKPPSAMSSLRRHTAQLGLPARSAPLSYTTSNDGQSSGFFGE